MSDESLLGKITATLNDATTSLGEHVTGAVVSEGFSEDGQFLLPADLKNVLTESMDALGFPLEASPGRLRDFSNKWHSFYRARVTGGYLAFLYVGSRLLESGVHGNEFAWIGMLFSQYGAKGIFIFSDSSRVEPVYDTQAESWQEAFGLQRAHFFHQGYAAQLLSDDPESRKTDLTDWLKLARFSSLPKPIPPPVPLKDDHERREKIVGIISSAAANAINLSPREYIKDLVSRTRWPESWKIQFAGMDGNAETMARALVDFAMSKEKIFTNPDYTAIGSLLEALISHDDADLEGSKFMFELIQIYHLITDETEVNILREKFQ
jgi:hypothetical protein